MWRKIVRVIGFVMAVALIAAYICYASHLAQEHRSLQKVDEVIISVSDSTETRQFTTSSNIRKLLEKNILNIDDELIDNVDAVGISDCISKRGFIRDVDVYVTYSGKVYIDVEQQEPILRLLCNGMNSYVTEDYDIFRSPQNSAYYTAVVTGSYITHFPRTYEGNILDYYDDQLAKEDAKFASLAYRFDSLRVRQRNCQEQRSKLRKSSRKRRLEREENHKQRVVGVLQEMSKCDKELAVLSAKKERTKQKQREIEANKKKLQKSCDDFTNLINFVSQIKEHSFWSAEIVQFVADVTTTGVITLRLVPRSGDFIIVFGTLDNSEEKLSKLQQFYDKGLSSIGWNEFKKIDVRYDKQVICTK